MSIITAVIYILMLAWAVFSVISIYRVHQEGTKYVNRYMYDNIPPIFVTIGILGTFVGIYWGLKGFDVNNITNSIPTLLEGLKTAFSTSIVGIVCSIIFGKVSLHILHNAEVMEETSTPANEVSALQELIKLQKESNASLKNLHNPLINEEFKLLQQISASLGDGETSLLPQIQKLREEQQNYSKEINGSIGFVIELMNENAQNINAKFDDFLALLAQNNTEALVEVMKSATEEFNKQMSAIIERLVQENFSKLNDSVLKMNEWQTENKEMISRLTQQFAQVSEDFSISAASIKEITDNTAKLTNENSQLTKLIAELQKVMIEDKKFQEITAKVSTTIETLQKTTNAFDETTNKLNVWVKNQINFTDSTAKLLVRLEEIDKIKDINEIFWADTKKQLNEGVSIIEKATKQLSEKLEDINATFYEELNSALNSLDTCIQRIVAKYAG